MFEKQNDRFIIAKVVIVVNFKMKENSAKESPYILLMAVWIGFVVKKLCSYFPLESRSNCL
jgi:hypothetical protein